MLYDILSETPIESGQWKWPRPDLTGIVDPWAVTQIDPSDQVRPGFS